MADDLTTDGAAAETATSALRCPWCSAPLASADAATCPSCGAALISEADPQLPGLTTVMPGSIARGQQPKRPSRLLSWITGDDGGESAPTPAAPGSLQPPPADVRREMLRLEMEAELSDLTAEAQSLAIEAELERRARGAGQVEPAAPPSEPSAVDPTEAEADARG